MTEVLFYHLERSGFDDVLYDLLEKTLRNDWRAVVRTGDGEAAATLDERLWTVREDSFLPHAAGGDAAIASRQPIWITAGDDAPNGADVLFLVKGATTDATALSAYRRCVTIFEGADEAAVDRARAFWKAAKAAGHDATYWSQSSSGRWEKRG